MRVKIREALERPEILAVLAYPGGDLHYAKVVLGELSSLGVVELVLRGRTKIDNVGVIGKGTTSVIVEVILDQGVEAVAKILRVDSSRESVTREAKLLRLANSVDVGPRLIGFLTRVLIMEKLEGTYIIDHLREMVDKGDANDIKIVMEGAIDQSFRLDLVGLDHGELSKADKHLIVESPRRRVRIIDFESASTNRRPSNLTSIVQYFLFRNPHADRLRELLDIGDLDQILRVLRAYKRSPSQESLRDIKRCLGL